METKEQTLFKSKRYILNEQIGQGTWGTVYSAVETLTGENVAIKILSPTDTAKEQMAHRGIDNFKAMKNEATKLSSMKNVVSRQFEVDENGNPFIVMPLYSSFLSDFLNEGSPSRKHLNSGLDLEEIIHLSKNISQGLSELHSTPGIERAHGDLKPDNIAMGDDHKVLLNDLGSSTCYVLGKKSESPRDNIGCLYTRAPECFNEKSHPNSRSDVWAMGSLMYRLFTGEYIFEKELNSAKDPKSFMENLDEKTGNKLISQKLKNIPRKFRNLIKTCTDINPYGRYSNGAKLLEELKNVEDSLDSWKTFKNGVRKYALTVALPILGAAGIMHSAITYEPKKLNMPEVIVGNPGLIYKIGDEPKGNIQFEFEIMNDLPLAHEGMSYDVDRLAKINSDGNRIVAYLLKTHALASFTNGIRSAPAVNDYQTNTYFATTPPGGLNTITSPKYDPWPAISRSIAIALTQSKTIDGKIDLEDVCAISRLGTQKVMEAKRIAKSNDWRIYRDAKYSDGKTVIPKDETSFINQWLSYYHADI